MYIYKVAVIGAGTMGAGIAQVMTYAGIPVILRDVHQDAVNRGLETVRKIYRQRVDKGKMTSTEMEQKMALVSGATDDSGFSDVDLVIEAVFEDLAVKRQLFCQLESVCPESAILASNTSSLSISAIAAETKRPEKVIGLHFFNPAPAMKLVEIIPGIATAAETADDLTLFSESIRKIPIRVQECAGFLVNRLLMPCLNEAALALEEQGGEEGGDRAASNIDAAMVQFGMPMGPFALLDTIGIDVATHVADILYDAFGPRMKPAAILGALYKTGRTGVKKGAGFYDYHPEDPGQTKTTLAAILKTVEQPRRPFSTERLILPMINEAVIALQEGVASAQDIDTAMMAGTGFPQDKGGPLHYADQIGIDAVLSKLQQYTRDLGERFWPAPMLKRMAGANRLGQKTGKGFFTY